MILACARVVAGRTQIPETYADPRYVGKAGVMPAKGGRIDLSDELIRLGVDYLVSQGH